MTTKKLKSIDIINVLSDLVSENIETTVKLPPIERILLRLDNDQAGRHAVHTMIDVLNKNYPHIKIDVAYPYRHKDWNDYLVYGIKHKENDIIIF